MVVDASAVVSILKGEATAASVETALRIGFELVMPSVTLTETALIGLKVGQPVAATVQKIRDLKVAIVPVDEALAIEAAEARHRFPIRFGDGFVYALAKARGLPILTLDAEFAKTDAALVPLN